MDRANVRYYVATTTKESEPAARSSVTSKLARGTFAVSFFLACLAVLELEGVQLTEL
jgi:hypothetical protein